MGALDAVQELRRVLDRLEYTAIASARDKGASVSEIARVLGVTRQALYLRLRRRRDGEPAPAERV